MKSFFFRTLGCKVNQYETEAMEELFLNRGYRKADREEEADVYIINTCTVTGASDAKSRQQINRIKSKNPKALVAVVGCYAQVAPEAVSKLDKVDLILGTKGRANIVDLVEEAARSKELLVEVSDLDQDRTFDELTISSEHSMTRAYIKIQEGCDMFCSYCIIPYARGHIASRDLDAVIKETRRLVQTGFKEFILTGIHVASYGKDLGGSPDLLDLVEAVAAVEGVQRIRLSSMEPRWITEDRLARLSRIPAFCDHFHLSLQSGSDHILKLMNRKYDRQLYLDKVRLIRSFFPDAGITTDIIVGFPGEEEVHFQETLDFVEEVGFSRIHVFPYSPRQGTPAASFAGAVSPEVKKHRATALGRIEEELRYRFLDSHIGKSEEVLFEEGDDQEEWMYGYTKNYIRVQAARDDQRINQLCQVSFVRREADTLLVEQGEGEEE